MASTTPDDFAARRKRPRRFDLIKILDDQQIGKIDAAGAYTLTRTSPGPGPDLAISSRTRVSGPPGCSAE
jgi:hypothetical protein